MFRSRSTLALIALLPLVAAGCLGTTEPTSFGLDCETLATTFASATNLTTTPSGLRYRDVIVGSGADVVAGSRLATQYSACTTEGLLFSEVAAPSLYTFTVGDGQVIAGLDEGVTGMKIGGRRELVIPPELGFGAQGSPGGFLVPNSTIVLTVDAVALR